MDDLGAIIIIAAFCASSLSLLGLGAALFITAMLFGLNAFGVTRLEHYLMIGVMLWVAMLFSGIHATLAGVIVAMTIPLTAAETGDSASSPLCRLEDRLGPWVAFLVLACVWLCQCGRTACRQAQTCCWRRCRSALPPVSSSASRSGSWFRFLPRAGRDWPNCQRAHRSGRSTAWRCSAALASR
jgi:Na+/H+ antiporter 1